MGVAPTVAMGPLVPSLIVLVTYQTTRTSVPILLILSKRAQSISLSALLKRNMKAEGNKVSILKTLVHSHFSNNTPKFRFGDGKMGKRYMKQICGLSSGFFAI